MTITLEVLYFLPWSLYSVVTMTVITPIKVLITIHLCITILTESHDPPSRSIVFISFESL